MTRVKICGLTRRADAELAVELGADALGFIFERSSPRFVEDEVGLRTWLPDLGPYVTRVAVYGPVPDHLELTGFQALQGLGVSRSLAPGVMSVAVLRLGGEAANIEAPDADAVLLDAHSSAGYGGTGRLVDWDQAAELVARLSAKVILAGGLSPENVAEAIAKVKPYAVDVSSGVEASPGVKDPVKLRDFLHAVKR